MSLSWAMDMKLLTAVPYVPMQENIIADSAVFMFDSNVYGREICQIQFPYKYIVFPFILLSSSASKTSTA